MININFSLFIGKIVSSVDVMEIKDVKWQYWGLKVSYLMIVNINIIINVIYKIYIYIIYIYKYIIINNIINYF